MDIQKRLNYYDLYFVFRFPSATCTVCRRRLKHPHTLKITNMYSPDNFRRTRTRSESNIQEEDCTCEVVCRRARLNGPSWNAFKSKHKVNHTIDKENHPKVTRICSRCKSSIYSGCSHPFEECKSLLNQLNNVISMLTPDQLDKICHSRLQEKVSQSGDSSISLQGAFGGKPMKVTVNSLKSQPKKLFTLQNCIALRSEG